jgi:hypothetical protein
MLRKLLLLLPTLLFAAALGLSGAEAKPGHGHGWGHYKVHPKRHYGWRHGHHYGWYKPRRHVRHYGWSHGRHRGWRHR